MNFLAHVEINVSDFSLSKAFYQKILSPLGWKIYEFEEFPDSVVGFKAPDKTFLFLVQTENKHRDQLFHRKTTGLNHLAFRVESREKVDQYSKFLESEGIIPLYHQCPKDYSSEYATEDYYAIFFEDPDRIKLEVVYVK